MSSQTAGTAVPYLRLASWDLGGLGDPRIAGKDPALIAEVLQRFDLVGLQGIAKADELEAIVQFLNSTMAGHWRRLSSPDVRSAASVIWREDRVAYSNWHRALGPEDSRVMAMSLAARFAYRGRTFYAVVSQSYASRTLPTETPEAQALIGAVKALQRASPHLPVFLFGSMGVRPDHKSLTPVAESLRPVLLQGDAMIATRGHSGAVDNIFTDYERPVRAGYYPFHKVLSLSELVAARKLSPHLPVFALTTLED